MAVFAVRKVPLRPIENSTLPLLDSLIAPHLHKPQTSLPRFAQCALLFRSVRSRGSRCRSRSKSRNRYVQNNILFCSIDCGAR